MFARPVSGDRIVVREEGTREPDDMTDPVKNGSESKASPRPRSKAEASLGAPCSTGRVARRRLVAEREEERASNLVPKIARAFREPGAEREALFRKLRPTRMTVYAYSIDPTDVTRIVREAEDGSKTVGRIVGKRFVPLKT